MLFVVFKFVHLLGVVALVGNVTVTAVWKTFADRSRDGPIAAFAQRLVTYTDWVLTGGGVVLILIGGYGMTWIAGIDPFSSSWLRWSQLAFYAAGLIWVFVLIPIQVVQARQAKRFGPGAPVPDSYWHLGRLWLLWGIVATLALILSLYLMIAKPA